MTIRIEQIEDRKNYLEVFEDFQYNNLPIDNVGNFYRALTGTDGQARAQVQAGLSGEGVVQLESGDDAAGTMAANGVLIEGNNLWGVPATTSDWLIFETRLNIDDITNVCFFVGFAEVGTLTMPFTIGSSDVFTSNLSNAVGFTFDTAADTDNIWTSGVEDNVDATHVDSLIAPVANTYIDLLVRVSSTGEADFFINGNMIGTTMTNAVAVDVNLGAMIAMFSRNTSQNVLQADYIFNRKRR